MTLLEILLCLPPIFVVVGCIGAALYAYSLDDLEPGPYEPEKDDWGWPSR